MAAGSSRSRLSKQFFDQFPLLEIQRDDAERFVGMLPHVIQDGLDDDRGFARIAAVLENAVWNKMVLHASDGSS